MIDCRSEEGITIGLIDSLIAISRVLRPRLRVREDWTPEIINAMMDLMGDEDIRFLVG